MQQCQTVSLRDQYWVHCAFSYSLMIFLLQLTHILMLFADDAAFVITASSLKELYSKIEKLVTDITNYLQKNRLVPNSSKSKLMMFSSRPTQNLCDIVYAGEVVEWVNEFKYLGLSLTNKLCFSSHINKVALNISRITGLFSQFT